LPKSDVSTGPTPGFWRDGAALLKKSPLRFALGVAISAAALALAFRSVSLGDIQKVASAVPARAALLYILAATSSLILRGLRWSVLLRAAGPVSRGVVFAVNCAGQMANNLLPARAGDLFRATSLGRIGIKTPTALATVFVERVLDAGFLVLISAIAIARRAAVPNWLAGGARVFVVIALLGLAFAVVTPHYEGHLLKLLGRIASERWRTRLEPLIGQFVLGLRSLSSAGRVSGFLLLTIAIWSLDGLGVFVLGRGLGLALTPSAVILLLTGLGLSSAVPAAPGNVGVFQLVGVTILPPFGVPKTGALVLVITLQVLILTNLLLWGTASLWYLGKKGAR